MTGGNPVEQCMFECMEECDDCEEEPPVKCGEGQKKCGEEHNPERPHCPDDICVQDNCECKYIRL